MSISLAVLNKVNSERGPLSRASRSILRKFWNIASMNFAADLLTEQSPDRQRGADTGSFHTT